MADVGHRGHASLSGYVLTNFLAYLWHQATGNEKACLWIKPSL